jgi:DNA adenine methylase
LTSPLLRWAGGKRWLVGELTELTSSISWSTYHEPFLGGASIYLGLPSGTSAFLSDTNQDLIETYEQVRDHPDEIAQILSTHVNTADHYYETRAAIPDAPLERAARFIFLNHTSFNGIYRVNLQGTYNVPFGERKSVRIPNLEHLREVSRRFKSVSFGVADFGEVIQNVKQGDLVFLDPPYTVAHNANGFVKYNQKLFSFEDQIRLSKLIDALRELGAYYVLTNAAHESIASLFEKGDRRLDTNRKNAVGGKSASRGTSSEYLFTNIAKAEGRRWA